MKMYKFFSIILLVFFARLCFANEVEKVEIAIAYKNYESAYYILAPLAAQGNSASQYQLGRLYKNGWFVRKDEIEAIKWYSLAAKQGNPKAQNNVGLMFLVGSGVDKSNDDAIKWLRLAAENGLANAQLNLALIYKIGPKSIRNESESSKWMKLASNGGISSSSEIIPPNLFVCTAFDNYKSNINATTVNVLMREALSVAIESFLGLNYRRGTFSGTGSSGSSISGTYTQYDNASRLNHYSNGIDAIINGSASISEMEKKIDQFGCNESKNLNNPYSTSDSEIENIAKIQLKALFDDNSYIDATSFNGRVLLTGVGSTLAQINQAKVIISSITKVKSIFSEVSLNSYHDFKTRLADEDVSYFVRLGLIDAIDLNDVSLKVITNEGTTYLMGVVDRKQADRATDIARSTRGVKRVVRVFEIR